MVPYILAEILTEHKKVSGRLVLLYTQKNKKPLISIQYKYLVDISRRGLHLFYYLNIQ